MTHTGPRHPSLPSAEAGGAAGAACKLGLPRHRGVRFTTFQPNLTVLYHLLVGLADGCQDGAVKGSSADLQVRMKHLQVQY